MHRSLSQPLQRCCWALLQGSACATTAQQQAGLRWISSSYGSLSHQQGGNSNQQGAGETIDFGFQEVPREKKQSLVAEVFSSVASSYDVMNDLMSGGMHRLWKDHLVSALRPFAGQHHLDVAGGTGDVAFRVLRAIRAAEQQQRAAPGFSTSPSSRPSSAGVPAGQGGAGAGGSGSPVQGSVTVVDINPAMLDEGRKKAASTSDLAADPGLTFQEGNAESLAQFPDSTFDSYTIAFGIRNVTDRDAALREALRVLKPGGRFLCLEFSRVRDPLLSRAYDAYSFSVIPAMGGLVAGDRASYAYLVESIRQFPDQDTFASMMERAGFRAVGYESILGGVVALHSGFKLPAAEA